MYNIFSDYRRCLKHIIKTTKRKYYSLKFSAVQGDMKKTWSLINELRGKSKSCLKAHFKINGELVKDKRTIADGFNKFFTDVAKNLNTKLYSSTPTNSNISVQNSCFRQYLPPQVLSSIFLSPCDPDEICTCIKSFDSNKASDISAVNILKRCTTSITYPLCMFLNVFMCKGVFPSVLKTGRITPIFKKGDPLIFDNYRPISILPVFGKIFEKIIYTRVVCVVCVDFVAIQWLSNLRVRTF